MLMQWWPSLDRVEDQLTVLKVLHKLPLNANDLLERRLPEVMTSVVTISPQRTTCKAEQLMSMWKRILSSAQRYRVIALVTLRLFALVTVSLLNGCQSPR